MRKKLFDSSLMLKKQINRSDEKRNYLFMQNFAAETSARN